jgi:hypothetical protein
MSAALFFEDVMESGPAEKDRKMCRVKTTVEKRS